MTGRKPPVMPDGLTASEFTALAPGTQLRLPLRAVGWIGLWSQLPYSCSAINAGNEGTR